MSPWSPTITGQLPPFSSKNARAFSVESSNTTVTTPASPMRRWRSSKRARSSCSRWHGTHHVAKKLTSVNRPRSDASE
jgi:hypothetical protein